MVKTVYNVPMISGNRYVHGPASGNIWAVQMLYAQEIGIPITLSGEWSDAQRHYKAYHPEHEERFVSTAAWTGTVLDYTDGTLKERIMLNPDGSFAEYVALGEKDGIYLPEESGPIRKLHDKHMLLVTRLHNVKDPRTELDPDAYFAVTPIGKRPVVRGLWVYLYDYRRVYVGAECDPADCRYAAWFVDEKLPENDDTRADYDTLERIIKDKGTELKRLEEMLSATVVLVK